MDRMQELRALAELLAMLLTSPRTGVLLALLAAAAVIDWRTLRIPNWLTAGGMLLGIAIQARYAPAPAGGAAMAVAGVAAGLLVLLPLWLVRLLGAGDVKLMAMAGAFIGPVAVLQALPLVLLAGGALALLFAISRGALAQLGANVRLLAVAVLSPGGGLGSARLLAERISVGRLPYGVCIAAGVALFLLARQLGFVT